LKGQEFLLRHVANALKSIFLEGRYADQVVNFYLKTHKKWGARDRRFFAEAVYSLVRWWRLYLNQLGYESSEEFFKKSTQLKDLFDLYLKSSPRELSQKSKAKGFAISQSYPDDLLTDFYNELGKDLAEKYLTLMNEEAAVYLRVNGLKLKKAEDLLKMLQEVEIPAEIVGPITLKLTSRKNVFITDPFKKGFFEVQDISSQRVAQLLDAKPGEMVIDACAGAGGKTLHLASLMENKGRLLAMDVHEKKLEQLKLRSKRAGVSNLTIRLITSAKMIKRQHGMADALLLDVPCSGSGVIKRNPDTKWKWSRLNPTGLMETQREILKNYSLMVKPGGRMVYATCSVLPRENEAQVTWFLEHSKGWHLKEQINIPPDRGDGFYAALLLKQ
jgi:16S rRNA (cytosine967-C5)-methyltransferase